MSRSHVRRLIPVDSSFRILTVCTGNVCRSPLAMYLLAGQLQDIPEVAVESAGTQVQVGQPMFDVTRQLAVSFGVNDTAAHRARQVNTELLESADLVLAMSREHRRHAVELAPRVTRRVFTIREFERLADTITDDALEEELGTAGNSVTERMKAAVRALSTTRNIHVIPGDPEDDDVVDPYRREIRVHEQSADQLESAVEAVVSLLGRVMKEDF